MYTKQKVLCIISDTLKIQLFAFKSSNLNIFSDKKLQEKVGKKVILMANTIKKLQLKTYVCIFLFSQEEN